MIPNTKFNVDGKFGVDLIMTRDQLTTMAAELMEEVNEQKVKAQVGDFKNAKLVWPIKDEIDEETEQPTGLKIVSFDQKAKITLGDGEIRDVHIAVLDSKKHPVPSTVKLGTGSTIRVRFRLRVVQSAITKDIRVKFHPIAAQIIKLVEWKSDFGFDDEDGFVIDPTDATTAAMAPTESDNPFADPETTPPMAIQAAGTAFQQAWQAFNVKMKGQTTDTIAKNWVDIKESWFGNRQKSEVRADEWKALIKSNFAEAPPEAEFDPEETFKASNLPF
jgi:hypothetical protein